jgi:hypothetical protein
VADDRVRVWTSGGTLYGCAPDRLAGLIEVRGLGVLPCAALRFASVALVVDAQASGGERMPEPADTVLEGVRLPCFRLAFVQAGSVAQLDRVLDMAVRRQALL